jgi:hypothetical protein
MKNQKTASQCWTGFQPEASSCWPSPTVKLGQVLVAARRRLGRLGVPDPTATAWAEDGGCTGQGRGDWNAPWRLGNDEGKQWQCAATFDGGRQALAASNGGGRVHQHEGVAEKVRHTTKWRKDGRGRCSPGRRSRQRCSFKIPVRRWHSGQLERTRGKGGWESARGAVGKEKGEVGKRVGGDGRHPFHRGAAKVGDGRWRMPRGANAEGGGWRPWGQLAAGSGLTAAESGGGRHVHDQHRK